MTVIILKPHTVGGMQWKPGEVVTVSDGMGAALVASGVARERKEQGPTETKQEPDDDAEGVPV